jgi:hypothetical protein
VRSPVLWEYDTAGAPARRSAARLGCPAVPLTLSILSSIAELYLHTGRGGRPSSCWEGAPPLQRSRAARPCCCAAFARRGSTRLVAGRPSATRGHSRPGCGHYGLAAIGPASRRLTGPQPTGDWPSRWRAGHLQRALF